MPRAALPRLAAVAAVAAVAAALPAGASAATPDQDAGLLLPAVKSTSYGLLLPAVHTGGVNLPAVQYELPAVQR